MMVTTVRGQLGPVTGTVEYDGKDVRTVKADVRIDVNGISLEYGLKWNSMVEAGPVVSDEVAITLDLEVTRPSLPAGTQ